MSDRSETAGHTRGPGGSEGIAGHACSRAPDTGLEGQLASIQKGFEKAAIVRASEIWATGGTASAIAKVAGRNTIEREEVAVLKARVRSEGPPVALRPERARVFHPGLLLMLRLLELAGADRVHYLKVSIGRVFLSVAGRSVRSWAN